MRLVTSFLDRFKSVLLRLLNFFMPGMLELSKFLITRIVRSKVKEYNKSFHLSGTTSSFLVVISLTLEGILGLCKIVGGYEGW